MKYTPTNRPCPDCEKVRGDGFPELQKSTGIRWYCWQCGGYFTIASDNKIRRIVESKTFQEIKEENDGDPSNPGNYQNSPAPVSRGFGGVPPKGTPGKPRVVTEQEKNHPRMFDDEFISQYIKYEIKGLENC